MFSQLELLAGNSTPPPPHQQFHFRNNDRRHYFSPDHVANNNNNNYNNARAASSPTPSSTTSSSARKITLRSPLASLAVTSNQNHENNEMSYEVSPATGNSKHPNHSNDDSHKQQQQHFFFDDRELFGRNINNNTKMNFHHQESVEQSRSPRPHDVVATSLSPSFDQIAVRNNNNNNNNNNNKIQQDIRSPSYFSATRMPSEQTMRPSSSSSVSPQPHQPTIQQQIEKANSSFLAQNFSMISASESSKKSNNQQDSNEEFLSTMLIELQTLNEKNRELTEQKAQLTIRAERAEHKLKSSQDDNERIKVHHKMLSQTSLEMQDELTSAKEQLDAAKTQIQRLIANHAEEVNELSSRLAREESFACDANAQLHAHRSSLIQFRELEKELRAEVEIAHDQMMEMAKEFDGTKNRLEQKVGELRSFISELQVRVEDAEAQARDAEEKRLHAENLLISKRTSRDIHDDNPQASSCNNTKSRPSSSSSRKPIQNNNNNSNSAEVEKQQSKKISDLEISLQNQQEEHRKRMKRQVKLESELEQVRTALQAANAEIEKQQHRYTLLVPQIEQLSSFAGGDCRIALSGQVVAVVKSIKNNNKRHNFDEDTPHHSSDSDDTSSSDDDRSSSSTDDYSSTSSYDLDAKIQPGDSLLVVDVDHDNTSVESAPRSSIRTEKPSTKKKSLKNNKIGKSIRSGRAISPQPELPPMYPSKTRSASEGINKSKSHSRPTTNEKSIRDNNNINRRSSSATKNNNNNPSTNSVLENTPNHLLQGSNPLFQVQFSLAIMKKMLNQIDSTNSTQNTIAASTVPLAQFQQQEQLLKLQTQQLQELRSRFSTFQQKFSETDRVRQSEHDHAVKERESTVSLIEQLQAMAEDLVVQRKEKCHFEAAVKNVQSKLEQEIFATNELRCKLDDSEKNLEKVKSLLTKTQAEKHAAEFQLRNDRSSSENSKKDLETLQKTHEEMKEKFEKHKTLLQNTLTKEQRRYTKALQHADKVETKFVAAQTEVVSLSSKLKAAENEIASKLKHIQSLEREKKDSAVKCQRTEAKLSEEDGVVSDLLRVVGNYDRAITTFVEILYKNTDFRCVSWDLIETVADFGFSSTNVSEMVLESGKEKSEGVMKLLSEFSEFVLLHLQLLNQAELVVLNEREKVEFLNAELEVYFSAKNVEEKSQKATSFFVKNHFSNNNNNNNKSNVAAVSNIPSAASANSTNSDISLSELMTTQNNHLDDEEILVDLTSPSVPARHHRQQQNLSPSSQRKSRKETAAASATPGSQHKHQNSSSKRRHTKNINDDDSDFLQLVKNSPSPPRSLFH